MKTFDQSVASKYNQDILLRVPGYEECHGIIQALLKEMLPSRAKILIVGSGSGKELSVLASEHPEWSFDAVEPSESMSDEARLVIQTLNLGHRVKIHQCRIEDYYTDTKYDAILSILVSHFIPQVEKGKFFESLSRSLDPKGSLFIFDLFSQSPQVDELFMKGLVNVSRRKGLDDNAALKMEENIRSKFFPISQIQLINILSSQGLFVHGTFMQALGFQGLIIRKKS